MAVGVNLAARQTLDFAPDTTSRRREDCRQDCYRERSPPDFAAITGSTVARSEACWEVIARWETPDCRRTSKASDACALSPIINRSISAEFPISASEPWPPSQRNAILLHSERIDRSPFGDGAAVMNPEAGRNMAAAPIVL